MTDDQFNKLFDYMHEGFASLDAKIDATQDYMQKEFASVHSEVNAVRSELKEDIQQVYSLLDQDAKHRETDDHERTALTAQVDRHEGWIQQLALKLGLKLIH